MNYIKILINGIVKENPTFVLLLGMCPTLATTTSAMNGMSMGLATMFVLICSNLVISLIKNLTPDMVRIPVFVVVIASFVTILQMLMQAYVPAIYATLGLYIPLIVVNAFHINVLTQILDVLFYLFALMYYHVLMYVVFFDIEDVEVADINENNYWG